MIDTHFQPHFSAQSRTAAQGTIVLSLLFIAILTVLHFLEPEFDPSWRMISEYELGDYGWLMSLAFLAWCGGVLSIDISIWNALSRGSGRIARWWLVVISIALIGASVFYTNAITDPTPRIANTLHSICGAIVILTFPIAAMIVSRRLAKLTVFESGRRGLTMMAWLTCLGAMAFFASIIISRAIDPTAGRVGPNVYLGWPNRLMVLLYHLWMIYVAVLVLRSPSNPK